MNMTYNRWFAGLTATMFAVLLAPGAAAGEFHYDSLAVEATVLLGTVSLYLNGALLYEFLASSSGTLDEWNFESDADCVVKHYYRNWGETLDGNVNGRGGMVNENGLWVDYGLMKWEWHGLFFQAQHKVLSFIEQTREEQTVEVANFKSTTYEVTGTMVADTGASPLFGAQALDEVLAVVRQVIQDEADSQAKSDALGRLDGTASGEVVELHGWFRADGTAAGLLKEIDWSCNPEMSL